MFNNNGESQMFNKKKKEVWLIIEKHDYSNVSSSYRVAKVAYSLDDAVAFKVSLEQLNERTKYATPRNNTGTTRQRHFPYYLLC